MTINIGGDASGAIAAVQRCQAAIDGLKGKTILVDFPRLPGETDAEWSARFEEFKRRAVRGAFEPPVSDEAA